MIALSNHSTSPVQILPLKQPTGLTICEQIITNTTDKDIIDKMNNPKIIHLTATLFAENYKKLIAFLMGSLGIKEGPNEFANEAIVYALKHKFQLLTFPEIKLAFTLNASGEYGEPMDHYQLLNIKFFGGVLAKYNERRQLVVLKTTPKQLPMATSISEVQKAANKEKLLETIFKDFANYQENPDKPILLADLKFFELEERNAIKLSNKVKWEYVEKAKAILKTRVIDSRRLANYTELVTTKGLLEKIIKEDFSDSKSDLQTIARELVIKDLFKTWAECRYKVGKYPLLVSATDLTITIKLKTQTQQ